MTETVWRDKRTGKVYLELPSGNVNYLEPIQRNLQEYEFVEEAGEFDIYSKEIKTEKP